MEPSDIHNLLFDYHKILKLLINYANISNLL